MSNVKILLENNRRWAAGLRERDPQFFTRLSEQQKPEYLWIGCADSRVPATNLTGLAAGELFVHRNVANVVVHTDLNCLSVMQFAVEVLQVKDIIVCGHYGCGGVLAALQNRKLGLIDNWLRHIQDVRHKYHAQLDALETEAAQFERLCELNVIEQVINASQTTVVQSAWERGQPLGVHGWIYGLRDGLVRDLEIHLKNQRDLERANRTAAEGITPHVELVEDDHSASVAQDEAQASLPVPH